MHLTVVETSTLLSRLRLEMGNTIIIHIYMICCHLWDGVYSSPFIKDGPSVFCAKGGNKGSSGAYFLGTRRIGTFLIMSAAQTLTHHFTQLGTFLNKMDYWKVSSDPNNKLSSSKSDQLQ